MIFETFESPFCTNRLVGSEMFYGRHENVRDVLKYIQAVINQGKIYHFFATGKRGMGKTSFVKYLSKEVKDTFQMIPIYVNIGGNNTVESLLSAIMSEIIKEVKIVEKVLFDEIKSGSLKFKFNQDPVENTCDDFSNFLIKICDELYDNKKGLFIVIDDMGGLADDSNFTGWYKSFTERIDLAGLHTPIVFLFVSYLETFDKLTDNGVNKLFMLSNNPPIGIMIFGAANFEGIPLETLIKEYRKQTNFQDKKNIIGVTEDFLNFLGKHTPNSNLDEMIKSGLSLFEQFIVPNFSQFDGETLIKFLNSNINQDLPSFLDNYQDAIKKYDVDFKNMIPNNIGVEYHEEIIFLFKNIFFNTVLRLGTGIVIAGFSESEMFPSVVNFQLCFNNNSTIEIIDYDELMNYSGNAIIPFAQKDVINTFLMGIDLNMADSIVSYFNNFLDKYLDELKKEFNSAMNLRNL